MNQPSSKLWMRGTVGLHAAAQRVAAGGSDGPLRRRLPDGPVTPDTLDRVEYITGMRPTPPATAAECRDMLVDWATRDRHSALHLTDDGTREYAVKLWSEAHLDQHEPATTRRMAQIGEEVFRSIGPTDDHTSPAPVSSADTNEPDTGAVSAVTIAHAVELVADIARVDTDALTSAPPQWRHGSRPLSPGYPARARTVAMAAAYRRGFDLHAIADAFSTDPSGARIGIYYAAMHPILDKLADHVAYRLPNPHDPAPATPRPSHAESGHHPDQPARSRGIQNERRATASSPLAQNPGIAR